MLVIPAIDLRDGAVVRLHQGQADQVTHYSCDPVSVAREWNEQGATWLHVVDLDGAFFGCPRHLAVLERMVKAIDTPIEFGGGLRSLRDIEQALRIGVARVILGSAALTNPELVRKVVKRYGERIAVAVDVRGGKVHTLGWQKASGDSPLDAVQRLKSAGIERIIYTDISRDGTMRGPNIEATKQIAIDTGLKVIASGGVSALDDIRAVKRIESFRIEGVIVGKALYERRFTLAEAINAAGS